MIAQNRLQRHIELMTDFASLKNLDVQSGRKWMSPVCFLPCKVYFRNVISSELLSPDSFSLTCTVERLEGTVVCHSPLENWEELSSAISTNSKSWLFDTKAVVVCTFANGKPEVSRDVSVQTDCRDWSLRYLRFVFRLGQYSELFLKCTDIKSYINFSSQVYLR